MNSQDQINSLAIQIARKTAFNSGEVETEKAQRTEALIQQKADIDFLAIMTDIDLEV